LFWTSPLGDHHILSLFKKHCVFLLFSILFSFIRIAINYLLTIWLTLFISSLSCNIICTHFIINCMCTYHNGTISSQILFMNCVIITLHYHLIEMISYYFLSPTHCCGHSIKLQWNLPIGTPIKSLTIFHQADPIDLSFTGTLFNWNTWQNGTVLFQSQMCSK